MSRETCKNCAMALQHALLGLLAERPASGYELTRQFEISLAHVWSASHSQIYPALQKMADAGWIEAGAEGSRGRKEYSITDSGRAELRRWLTEVPPARASRNEAMMRVFFLWTLEPNEAADYLDDEADVYDKNQQLLDRLDTQVPWDEGGADFMGRLALEQGRRWSSMNAQWARWAAEQIRAGRNARSIDTTQPAVPAPADTARQADD